MKDKKAEGKTEEGGKKKKMEGEGRKKAPKGDLIVQAVECCCHNEGPSVKESSKKI